jgi:hypothetical protein
MDSDISKLWQEMINYGYDVNKTGQNGLVMWQPMKTKYDNMMSLGKVDNPVVQRIIYNNIVMGSDDIDLSDLKFVIDDVILDNKIENHHFFIQHFRIPMISKFNLTRLKLLQIAYNAGQFKARREKNYYDEKIMTFYDNNKLDQIQTYLEL